MIDRTKVIKGLESLRDICNAKSNMAIGNGKVAWVGYANTADDALALLKEWKLKGNINGFPPPVMMKSVGRSDRIYWRNYADWID